MRFRSGIQTLLRSLLFFVVFWGPPVLLASAALWMAQHWFDWPGWGRALAFFSVFLSALAGQIAWMVWRARRRPRCGIHVYGKASEDWAKSRFPPELQPVAAYLAELLVNMHGVNIERIEPCSRFIEELGMDDLEPVEVVMALEVDLGIEISEESTTNLVTVAELVSYLHRRLAEAAEAKADRAA